MNRDEVKVLLEILHKAYPTTRIDDYKSMVDLWSEYLKDYPKEALIKAAKHHIARSKFFPSIAELISVADRFAQMIAAESLALPEGNPKTLTIEDSGCPLCPYYEPGQRDFCDNCLFEGGGSKNDT